MNILLTDILFPNKYAKWRLVEIKSFIDKYKIDILCVKKIENFAGLKFNFDWNELYKLFNLQDYDILIFNSKFNYINKYNKIIDGTLYNGKLNADYMLRHKTRRYAILDFNIYNIIYHIFLSSYIIFNTNFNYPKNRQFIHIYPGGGYSINQELKIDKNVKIISSQQFISKSIKENKYINIFGCPFYYKYEPIIQKYKKGENEPLCVCFTSLGDPHEKGAFIYHKIVDIYKQNYPTDKINFISIGVCPTHKFIKSLLPMDQISLSKFYKDKVDILLSLDTGKQLNGFPLGVEGMQAGCVVLTTDVHNQNKLNNFNFDTFYIIDKDNIIDIIRKIHFLTNKNNCFEKGRNLQKHVYKLFNYENTMEKIFNFIEENIPASIPTTPCTLPFTTIPARISITQGALPFTTINTN